MIEANKALLIDKRHIFDLLLNNRMDAGAFASAIWAYCTAVCKFYFKDDSVLKNFCPDKFDIRQAENFFPFHSIQKCILTYI